MSNITKDWDIYDILFAHEDSYTNMLQYLFENSEEFRDNLSLFLFEKKMGDLTFLTRKAYNYENDTRRNIPDIIICNKDHFAIIEVKVYASEGAMQTIRYYESKEEIKKAIGVEANAKERFLFLTLYGTQPSCELFEPITWTDIGDLLPTKSTNDNVLDILVAQLKTRIDSLKGRKIDEKEKWHDAVKTMHWGGAIGLYNALKLHFSANNIEIYKDYFWASYKQSKNTYTYSALFVPYEEWCGLSLKDENVDKNKHQCYELHFEFDWDEEQSTLEARLDYHLNPYLSNKDIKNLDINLQQRAQECNKIRQTIAQNAKSKWHAPKGWENCYNHRITNNIMKLIHKTFEIKEGMLVEDVASEIIPFMKAAIDFVNNVILPEHIK